MKKMFFLSLFLISGVISAVEIQDVVVWDYSSYYYGTRYDFYPDYVINGYGLDPETGFHNGDRWEYTYWMNGIGTKVVNGDQFIEFRLGPIPYYLTEIHIWNFNRHGYTSRGTQDMEILVRNGGSYTSLGVFTLGRGTGQNDYPGETIQISHAEPVSYVKFVPLTTYGDASYGGLSEVRFYGNGTSNEPPYVFAGKPMQVQGLTATLKGVVTDDAGTPGINWSKISGPGNVTFTDPSDPATEVTFSEYGLYELELSADDSSYEVYQFTTVRCIPEWWKELDEVAIDSSTTAYSQYYEAVNVINGSGLYDTGYHTAASYNYHWCSASSPSSAEIVFALETTTNINGLRIWNFNHSYAGYLENCAISNFEISVSNDKTNWESLGTFSLDNAPDWPWDTSEIIPLAPSQSYQYIKFHNFSSFSSTNVAFSEVRFSGTPDNTSPTVDAGADIETWLAPVEAVAAIDITAEDDGEPSPPGQLAYTWTKVSGPEGYSFDSDSIEDPTVTFTEAGEYEFQVEVTDSEFIVTDNVIVTVYLNGCEHAKAQPEYVPLPGDADANCKVNLADFSLVAAGWLECNSSDPNDCL
jgi:hypothetical protein